MRLRKEWPQVKITFRRDSGFCRLLLSSLAYMLLEAIRHLALKGTGLANAYVGTLRLKLLKIGAVILRNARRIRFLLYSAMPRSRSTCSHVNNDALLCLSSVARVNTA
jgi:hypothetical protein